jgi:hypothetical protein
MNFIKIGGRIINIDHIAQVTRTKNAVGECVAIHLTDCGGTGTIVHQLEGKLATKVWAFFASSATDIEVE